MNATDKKLAHRRNMLMAMDTIAHEINNEEWYMDTVQCYMLIMSELIATEDMHNLTY